MFLNQQTLPFCEKFGMFNVLCGNCLSLPYRMCRETFFPDQTVITVLKVCCIVMAKEINFQQNLLLGIRLVIYGVKKPRGLKNLYTCQAAT